jgi:hypothetical protein
MTSNNELIFVRGVGSDIESISGKFVLIVGDVTVTVLIHELMYPSSKYIDISQSKIVCLTFCDDEDLITISSNGKTVSFIVNKTGHNGVNIEFSLPVEKSSKAFENAAVYIDEIIDSSRPLDEVYLDKDEVSWQEGSCFICNNICNPMSQICGRCARKN